MIAPAAEASGLAASIATFAEPWNKVFSHSKVVSAGTLFFHLVPLITAGGVAFAADIATLRAFRAGAAERSRQVAALAATHRWVVLGLAVSFISGILLFLSDVETFLGSIYIWIKLGFVALLLINGFVLLRIETALARNAVDDEQWNRLRRVSMLSAFLWIATTLAGVVLKEFA
ncbi:MAG: hypothetical protein M3Z05_20085 [Gemmatimonadota bacterium]|nr:hypothetical protein [Gemmatimonadota bacterium]